MAIGPYKKDEEETKMANNNGRIDGVMKRIFIEAGVLFGVVLILLIVLICLWSRTPGDPSTESTPPVTTDPPSSTQGTTPIFTLPPAPTEDTSPEGILAAFIKANNLTRDDYGENVLEVYDKFPEVQDFILQIPLKKGQAPVNDISWADRSEGVPLFLQYDDRWGYTEYGASVCGLSGCGPTCLSMAGYYLTGDETMTPAAVAAFAEENHYYAPGYGSSWTLISEGAEKLGLTAKELPLVKGKMVDAVEAGHPVILALGPGDFTTSGHYIVLTGWEDGAFRVNDPNSRIRSGKLWTYEELESQIRNIWEISL